MKTPFISALLLLVISQAFGQIMMADSSVQVVSYWDKGDNQSYSVSVEKIKIKDSDTVSKVMTNYEVEITVLNSTKKSYTIEWLYKSITTDSPDILSTTQLKATKDMKVIFKTDELGVFVEVVNWKEIKDYIQKSLVGLKKKYKNSPEMDKTIRQIEGMYSTKEAIESVAIKDIQQFHSFHGAQYKLGELVEATLQVPNLYGPEPFDAYVTVLLDEINEEDNNFILRTAQEVDKDQLTNATFNFLTSVAKNMHKDPPKREDIKGLENEILTSSRIHGSGWVVYSIQTTTVSVDNFLTVEERIIELK